MPQSDEELIVHVLAIGDMETFGDLVERHQDRVRRTLLRLTAGNRAEADDLAQDTFIHAYNKLASYRGPGSFGPWLSRIATTLFL
jgi:RNA polymerase sigma-70 factor, ECF subfamily